MDIEGLGEVLIEQLVDGGFVRDVADLYSLEFAHDFRSRKNGGKEREKVIDQIANSKTRGLQRLLFGMDIRHIGERYSKILANRFSSVEAIGECLGRRAR